MSSRAPATTSSRASGAIDPLLGPSMPDRLHRPPVPSEPHHDERYRLVLQALPARNPLGTRAVQPMTSAVRSWLTLIDERRALDSDGLKNDSHARAEDHTSSFLPLHVQSMAALSILFRLGMRLTAMWVRPQICPRTDSQSRLPSDTRFLPSRTSASASYDLHYTPHASDSVAHLTFPARLHRTDHGRDVLLRSSKMHFPSASIRSRRRHALYILGKLSRTTCQPLRLGRPPQ